jgi:hypothetical protein
MPQSRRNRRLGRWSQETYLRDAPLDEVPAGATRITIPRDDAPESQRPVTADAAALALRLRELRRSLWWARWIPWRRRKRAAIQSQISALVEKRQRLRRKDAGAGLHL